jgi:type II secretion system protein D
MRNMIRNHVVLSSIAAFVVLSVVLAYAQAPQPGITRPGISAQPRAFTPSPRSFTPRVTNQPAAPAATAPDADAAGTEDETEPKSKTLTPSLKFDAADAQFLLEAYARETGRTLLIAPDLPKVQGITLRSQKGVQLSREEYLEAIEVTLSMNGITLEEYGDKFLKVLPSKTIRSNGIKINMTTPEGGLPEKSRVVSQMIQLKAITITEAQKALEGFKRPDGLIQSFERTNSLLVTDTQENINRMLEVVKFIDQPLVATEEVNVRMVHFAKADDIKKRLEELVAESQKQSSAKDEIKANSSGAPGMSRTIINTTLPFRPGLTRLGQPTTTVIDTTPNENISTLVNDADRGMIRGKVQIIADERSNQLIIITRKENMDFFDKIITVLDIETAPDVKVEVRRLEFADAEEVSTMLNDLIGNATAKKDDSNKANTTGMTNGRDNGPGGQNRSTSLTEAVKARSTPTTLSPSTPEVSAEGKSKLGQLSKENIKILADKRTNAIVMMGSPNDLKAINDIIAGMDIQLSQVLIETVILQVQLGGELATGIDWVKRGKHTTYVDDTSKPIYASDGTTITGYQKKRVVTRDTVFNNGDQSSGGGGTHSSLLNNLLNVTTATTTGAVDTAASTLMGSNGSGLSYFLKSDKLDIAALIEASKSDSRTKVLSSPVLMTVDNKEATIEATDMRYLYKGVRYSGSSYNGSEVPDYEQRDIGLTVKITPRINPNGTVVLTIDEKFETIGANQTVGSESYPTVTTRQLQADVSLENMQTVVLGGLVQNENKTSESGIPILKDIPIIGKYLFGSTSATDSRSELLVFLTPYVLNKGPELEAEAARRKAALSDDRPWIDNGWSKSKLADPVSPDEKMRRLKQKWANEDADHKAELLYQKAMKAREEQLKQRDTKEAEDAAKDAAKESEKKAEESDKNWVSGVKVSEQSEVVKPNAAPESVQPAPDQKAPVSDPAEPEKKSWWKFW